jgi:AcrR family transcriptional regulator
VTRHLLSASGPRSVTLDQVAARSEVAKTSILWHFGSKQELFLEALDEVIGDFEKAFSARYPDESSPAEKLGLFFRDYAEFMKEHPHLGDVFFSFAFSDRSDEPLTSARLSRTQGGSLRRPSSASWTASSFSGHWSPTRSTRVRYSTHSWNP